MPTQGLDNLVFFVTSTEGVEYAVKAGEKAHADVLAVDLIQEAALSIALPKVLASFTWEGKSVLVMEKITQPLLVDMADSEKGRYIPSMLHNMHEIHKVRSDQIGYLASDRQYKDWRAFLLADFVGDDRRLDWDEITTRRMLDKKLIDESISRLVEVIVDYDLPAPPYALLHTDFNQRNLFVDPEKHEIAAIIDWSEALWGDPLLDFARIRMFIWHFRLGNEVENEYYRLQNYSAEERKREQIYWLYWVIEYLAWYTEDYDDLSISRIQLHQEFLREVDWKLLQ